MVDTNQSRYYDIKRGNLPPNFIVLGILMIIAAPGLFFITSSLIAIILAPVVFIGSLILLAVRTGILIDFEEKRIVRYFRFLKYKYTVSDSAGGIKYVSLVRVRLNRQAHADGCSTAFIDHSYNLNLVSGEKKYITLLTGNKDIVIKHALSIAEGFGVRILDNTDGKMNWIITAEIADKYQQPAAD